MPETAKSIRKEFVIMSNRNRKKAILLYLSDDEQYIFEEKFKASGLASRSAFLRNLIIYGFVYDVDYSALTEYNQQLGKIGTNINQIAHKVNSTGSIYQNEVKEMKEMMDKIWHIQKSMLLKQQLIKQ